MRLQLIRPVFSCCDPWSWILRLSTSDFPPTLLSSLWADLHLSSLLTRCLWKKRNQIEPSWFGRSVSERLTSSCNIPALCFFRHTCRADVIDEPRPLLREDQNTSANFPSDRDSPRLGLKDTEYHLKNSQSVFNTFDSAFWSQLEIWVCYFFPMASCINSLGPNLPFYMIKDLSEMSGQCQGGSISISTMK